MTTPALFPTLPGLGWSVHKKPTLSTRVASHTSGREVRAGLYARALYEFELTFDGLDSAGNFPSLQSNSLQTLMGFFLSMQGQLNTFLYTDPTDNTVTNQVIGTGDGLTTAFALGRSIGGYYEPISYATNIAAVYLNGCPMAVYNFTPPNTISFPVAPLGPTTAIATLAETATTGYHTGAVNDLTTESNGTAITFGGYFLAAGRTQFQLSIYGGSTYPACTFDLSAGTATPGGGAYNPVIIPLANGWYYCAFAGTWAGSGTPSFRVILMNAGSQSYTGTAGLGVTYSQLTAGLNGGVFYSLPALTPYQATVTNGTDTPPTGSTIAVSFSYAFQCRFLDDQWDFENFMSGLWTNKSIKFRSVR